jgi:hypothetical protein
MTHISALSSTVDTSVVENSNSSSRRGRRLDIGYILFGFGALWVLAIAAGLAVPRTSLPNCQLTVLGDVAVCAAPYSSPGV